MEDNQKNNEKELIEKNDIDANQLEKIQEEIKRQTTISEEKKNKINNRIFKNIIIAIIIVLYFIFINLGFNNIESSKYLKDLQVFSIITICITVIIFEKAYKKDSIELTTYGIETLVLSICTLMTIYIGINYNNKYTYIINLITVLFALYYAIKASIMYIKMRKKALKRTSDIHKIVR